MDAFVEAKKKENAFKVIELLLGRSYPITDISDVKKKRNIMEQAEVFYRDHIYGASGKDAAYHNIAKRFPDLNEKIMNELSAFSDRMHEAGDDLMKIQEVINNFGISVDFNAERLKALLRK